MAVGDGKKEGSVSYLNVESLESSGRGDVLSAEDLAWVDSCLINDPEISDSNWNDLKDALLEIVNFQPEAMSCSSSGKDGLLEETDIEMHVPSEEAETAKSGKNDDDVQMNVGSETNNDSSAINQKTGIPLAKISEGGDTRETFLGNLFWPTYKEGQRVSEAIDLGLDLDPLAVESEPLSEDTRETSVGNPFLPSYKESWRVSDAIYMGPDMDSLRVEVEIKPLTEEIFKVWDLGILDEGDELITQLNNTLPETSPESILPSAIDDSGTWKDSKDESIDNLIAGIADLSLDQNSS